MKKVIFVVPLLIAILNGCSSHPKLETLENGFINNYQQLTPVKNTDGYIQDRWVSPKLTRKNRPIEPSSFYIKPIIYYPNFDRQSQFMRNNADKILSYLTIKTRQAAEKYFPVVDRPTRGTFIIAPAITQVKISLESLKPTELLPVGAALAIGKHLLGTRDRDVELRMENKITYADNNEPLVSMVLRGDGEQLENDKEQLSVKHLKPILDAWIAQWDHELAEYKKLIDKRHQRLAASTNAEVAN